MTTPTDSLRHEPGPDDGRVSSTNADQTASSHRVGHQRSHTDDGLPEGQRSSTGTDESAAGAQPLPHSYEDDGRTFLAARRRPTAAHGWRKVIANITGGRINPGPSAEQQHAAELIRRIRVSLDGVHKVAFVCAKGGVGKSTMAVAVGNVIARVRGDRVIAVDVDPDLGDSARFSERGGPQANIEQVASLQNIERYSNVRVHTVVNNDRLELLSAQNDPKSTYTLGPEDYAATMKILELHCNVILLDCGTSITDPLFSRIASDVSGLVVVASQDVRGVEGALATLDWLYAHGFDWLLPQTVVALNATRRRSAYRPQSRRERISASSCRRSSGCPTTRIWPRGWQQDLSTPQTTHTQRCARTCWWRGAALFHQPGAAIPRGRLGRPDRYDPLRLAAHWRRTPYVPPHGVWRHPAQAVHLHTGGTFKPVNGQLNLCVRPRRLSQDRPSSRTTAETTGPPSGSWAVPGGYVGNSRSVTWKADIIARRRSAHLSTKLRSTINRASSRGPGSPLMSTAAIRKGSEISSERVRGK
jgi:MinD-like ATPase involved in chromosome partitioning or flagellar assembly